MPVSRIWELLAKKYNDEISADELQELELFLNRYQDVFQLNEILSGLDDIPLQKVTSRTDEEKSLAAIKGAVEKSNNEEQLLAAIASASERKKRLWKQVGWLGSIAACVVLVWIFLPSGNGSDEKKPVMSEVATNAGSKSTIRLPDGSTVKLNTNSSLQYNEDFGIGGRKITLTGEAFFDIVKNEAQPLTVQAGNVNITVKGTIFNVRAYQEDATVEASLIEGAIEVSEKSDPERKILLRPNEKILIGQTLVAPAGKTNKVAVKEAVLELGKIKPNPTDSSINEIVWVEDELTFYREPFYSLAQKMERWYNISIRFETEKIKDMSFTGSFEKENIIEALDALQHLASFTYSLENKIVTIRGNE